VEGADRLFCMSHLYRIERAQIINTNLQTAWDFLSNPRNLNRITPDSMQFEVCSELPDAMYAGLLIEYKIHLPLLGQQTWLSEIKYLNSGHSFVDEQRMGPYKFWYHYHSIEAVEEGVCFKDQIHYRLPGAPFDRLVHALYVKKQLATVFDYRCQRLAELLDA
jgi:ligand-binding SRPBCC domain-containing protein